MSELINSKCPICVRGTDPYRETNKGGECKTCNGLGLLLTPEGKQFEKLLTAVIMRNHLRSAKALGICIKNHFERQAEQLKGRS